MPGAHRTSAGVLAGAAPLLLLLLAGPARAARLPAPASAIRDAAARNGEASMQIAARQRLFDYAVAEALAVLNATLRNATLPEVDATVEVPLLGGIDVAVRDVNVTRLDVDPELTRVAIEAGYYHAAAANVTANITFAWAWSKGPLGGSGTGELFLEGGSVDIVFLVRNQEAGAPQLVPVSSAVAFRDLSLSLRAASADWLYQALLFVFSGAVRRQIEAAMDDALRTAVPAAVNDALATLPSSFDVRGLPFSAVFTYAVYTTSYVVVKGYAEVDAPDAPAPSLRAPPPLLPPRLAAAGACPFPSTPLPLTPAQIGGEVRMASLYAHDSVLNCVAWGLFHAGALKTRLQDGELPGLRLITDLFGALMPDLPKAYPKHGILLEIEATAPPTVAFADPAPPAPSPSLGGAAAGAAARSPGSNDGGGGDVSVSLSYSTVVSVLNASADGAAPLEVARLAANLSFAADFGWDAAVVGAVNASYAVVNASTAVAPDGWSKAIEWALRQSGARLALSALWDAYVVTPAAPSFGLYNVTTGPAGGGWRGLSADVRVAQPVGGGGGGRDGGGRDGGGAAAAAAAAGSGGPPRPSLR
ncbi:hypothetical protein Rsub_09664 [Raphidocelis subcapitata]|uniref:Lipid-binding serum glycoprotein C-terminal domain-containing protein n=1 Tax=Raphidocelis subcapitata TaxID=307507 RepID=A0A2V0PAC3_9CHLO|nr:hypothetical protein Rsub_09664 [Raphidocelis subcapitata]|eukprot:GBF96808.1 hypothetical protein Rsub_09664 [Raphidocelis subcapitata]